jgi:hypothetical protein
MVISVWLRARILFGKHREYALMGGQNKHREWREKGKEKAREVQNEQRKEQGKGKGGTR